MRPYGLRGEVQKTPGLKYPVFYITDLFSEFCIWKKNHEISVSSKNGWTETWSIRADFIDFILIL